MIEALEPWGNLVIESVDRGEILILFRVLIAAFLGAILGWERESQGKAAGLRTHILVCMAAAMYSGVSLMIVAHVGDGQDALRAVPAIATGIGFIGAGLIFVNRTNDQVHGLTTAASIWATASLGMAAGFGYWFLSIGATLLVFLTLRVLAWTIPIHKDRHGLGKRAPHINTRAASKHRREQTRRPNHQLKNQ